MKLTATNCLKMFQLATGLTASCALVCLAGCGGPSVPKTELMEHIKKVLPDGLELADVGYKAVPAPNAQSAAIPLNTKITARATQDLYSAPTQAQDIKPVNDFINAYNVYANWTNAIQMTSYADELNRDKPKINSTPPRFLHRDQSKGETFTGYLDVAAEHQMDRWIFKDGGVIDWVAKKPGATAARFGSSCVGANAPDGQAAVRALQADEASMNQFREQFASKHAAESQPLLQALQPLLTSGQVVQTFAVFEKTENPNYRFNFSEYDPKTRHFRVRYRSVMGDFMGSGEIDGSYILLFQDGANSQPASVAFVGLYDAQSGDVLMRHGGRYKQDDEILHTRRKY